MIRPLAEIEREAILQAIQLVGDKVEVAKLLGIGKTTLYRKLTNFGYSERPGFATLLRQAAALRDAPIRARREQTLQRYLQIPSTLLELEQATLRCPKCRTALIDAQK